MKLKKNWWIIALAMCAIFMSGWHFRAYYDQKRLMVLKIRVDKITAQIEQNLTTAQIIWPDVFTDPNFKYEGEKIYERSIADGLEGWGLCYAGNQRPETFGQGMAKIAIITKSDGLPETLKGLVDKLD